MNNKNDFNKYAINHMGVSGLSLHRFKSSLTPYIMEERELNVAQIDVFSRLMMERVIFLGTEINDTVSNIIQAQLLYLESIDNEAPIKIYINSPGGSVYAGLGIYDTMQYVKPKISTICTGLAASMGAILLCAGAKGSRLALPHSRVMIHQPSGGIDFAQASDIEITHNEINKLKKELYDILVKHSGKDYEKIKKDADRDYWMTSYEAKDYGLVDTILIRKTK